MNEKNKDICDLIKKSGISLDKIALQMDISRTTLDRWLKINLPEAKRIRINLAIAHINKRKFTPNRMPKASYPKRKVVFSLFKMRQALEHMGQSEKAIIESERIWSKHDGKEVCFTDSDVGFIADTNPRIEVRRDWCEKGV